MNRYENLLVHRAVYQLPGGARYTACGCGSDGVFVVWILIPEDEFQPFDAPRQGLWLTPTGRLGIARLGDFPLGLPDLTCNLLHTYADGDRPLSVRDLKLIAFPSGEEPQRGDSDFDIGFWREALQ